MTSIGNILTPNLINLDLKAKLPDAAVLEVAGMLRHHPKVKNWEVFFNALKPGTTCMVNDTGYGICIPHARTNDVSAMVMAAGRSRSGVVFTAPDGTETTMHYIIVIGIPTALAQDYLRLIGAIARTFRSAQSELALRSATTPEAFIEILAAYERTM